MGDLIVVPPDYLQETDELEIDLVQEGQKARMTYVLRMIMHEGMILAKALSIAEVPRSTWYDWRNRGLLIGPTAEVKREAKALIDEIVMPNLRKSYKGIASIAVGEAPEGTTMEIKPRDMMAAHDRIVKATGILTTDQDDTTEIDNFLSKYQPPEMVVVTKTTKTLGFIYTEKNGPTLPKIPEDDDNEIAGELVEKQGD